MEWVRLQHLYFVRTDWCAGSFQSHEEGCLTQISRSFGKSIFYNFMKTIWYSLPLLNISTVHKCHALALSEQPLSLIPAKLQFQTFQGLTIKLEKLLFCFKIFIEINCLKNWIMRYRSGMNTIKLTWLLF